MNANILIVDDQPMVLDILKQILDTGPYTIFKAQSGPEALEMLKHQSIDVVISDECMPGMAGTELLAMVREQYPDTVRIILTGYASVENTIRAINEAEIYRFLTKPCSVTELRSIIEEALAHRAGGKSIEQSFSILESLEKQAPGITHVKRDDDGAVIIDED